MASSRTHWPLTLLGGAVSLLNLLLPLVLVRVLEPTDIGHYKVFFLYISQAPSLLMTTGITNGLSYWAGHENKRLATTQVSWTLMSSLTIAVLLIGLPLVGPLGASLQWSQHEATLLVFGVAAMILATFFEDSSVARGHIMRGAFFGSGFDLARNISMGISAFHFRTLDSVLYTYIGVLAVKITIGMVWGYFEKTQRWNLKRETLRAVVTIAFPVSIAAVFAIIQGMTDLLLLSKLLAKDMFAVYSIGCLTVPPLLIFEQSVNKVLIPRMARAFAEGGVGAASARRSFQQAVGELSWLMIPATVGLIVFARPIIVLLFTERFVNSADFLRIYAIMYALLVLPYDSVARAKGNGKWILRRLIFFSFVSMASVTLGFKLLGAKGALCGTIFSLACMRISAMLNVSRTEKWALSSMLPLRQWGLFLVLSGIGVFEALVSKEFLGNGLAWFLISGGSFAVFYLGLTWRTFWKNHKLSDITG